MNREAFINRWKKHLAGMALFGTVSERNDGPIVRASKILEIPAEVEKLLGQMWDDLREKTDNKPLPANGAAKPERKAT